MVHAVANAVDRAGQVAQAPEHQDPQVRIMAKLGIPLTRQNYLNLAYMGQVPNRLSAEEEAGLPQELQRRP